MEACKALKLLLPTFDFRPNEPNPASRRVNSVDRVPGEEVMPRAADVADLCDNITWQFLLDHEIPILVREILTMAVNRFRAEELVLRIQERHERIRQSWKGRRAE